MSYKGKDQITSYIEESRFNIECDSKIAIGVVILIAIGVVILIAIGVVILMMTWVTSKVGEGGDVIYY